MFKIKYNIFKHEVFWLLKNYIFIRISFQSLPLDISARITSYIPLSKMVAAKYKFKMLIFTKPALQKHFSQVLWIDKYFKPCKQNSF